MTEQLSTLKFWLILAGMGCILALAIGYWNHTPVSTQPHEQPLEKVPASESAPATTRNYVRSLTEAGWNHEAASAVVELNAEWFSIMAEENPNGLERQLKLLAELGKHVGVHGFLREHPETAGLLAGCDDPEQLAASLEVNADQYPVLAALYMQHASPEDASELAKALHRNRDLIFKLQQRGLIGCEVLFLFDRQHPSTEVYENWLREVISYKLQASDVELASFVNLVMHHGPLIRHRLRDDQMFRNYFHTTLWPRFQRAADGENRLFELYLNEPRVWDLLALDEGEELLKRCGQLALLLLYGYPEIKVHPYPQSLHPKIIQILLQGNELAIRCLYELRQETLFHEFLTRDLSPHSFRAALHQLSLAGPNYPELLAYYQRLSDVALAEELKPAPSGIITWIPLYYTVYEVPKKLLQGRTLTTMDILSATIDPIFLVIDIIGPIVSREALLIGSKEAAELAARELAEKGSEKLFVITLRDSGLDLARKQLGKEVGEKMSEEELLNWCITATISEMQHAVQGALNKATTFEITRPLQFMYENFGLDRKVFKRITGLEPRLFMRGDSKVFVRLNNLPSVMLGKWGGVLFERTAQDLSMGMVFESDLGQMIVEGVTKEVISSAQAFRAWQQNASAWWLLHASGEFSQSPDSQTE